MIGSLTFDDGDDGFWRAIARLDPVVHGVCPLTPFPDARLVELLELAHDQVAVSADVSRLLLQHGDPFRPLRGMQITGLVVLEAHTLLPGAVRDLAHAVGAAGLNDQVSVTLVGERSRAYSRRLAEADGYAASVAPVVRALEAERALLPAGGFEDLLAFLDESQRLRVRELAKPAAGLLNAFPARLTRLGALVTARRLLHGRPWGLSTCLRLCALNLALATRDHTLVDAALTESAASGGHTGEPISWLDDYVKPPLPLDDLPCLDATLAAPLPATAETAAQWAANHPIASTFDTYSRALRHLLQWREDQGIECTVHDTPSLTLWAYDRLARGDAQRSVTLGLTVARRWYVYLLTGLIEPPAAAFRDALPCRSLAYRLPSELRHSAHGVETIATQQPPLSRPRLVSPDARYLLHLTGTGERQLWEIVDRLRLADALWEPIALILGTQRPSSAVHARRRLNAAVVVMATGCSWRRLPREFGYGSGTGAQRAVELWNESGAWGEIERLLDGVAPFRDVDWRRGRAAGVAKG